MTLGPRLRGGPAGARVASPRRAKEGTVPEVRANGINVNYGMEGEGEETVVLVNGLADDLES